MTTADRLRNPFQDPLVTELIEDPALYREMFSEQILVGETLTVFQPLNVILVGPQGSGKSMILNLVRYNTVSAYLGTRHQLPRPLESLAPYLGISINLVRAGFHIFGRRSPSKAMKHGEKDVSFDVACASDFLAHYLLREFIKSIQFLQSKGGSGLRKWMSIDENKLDSADLSKTMASWDSWFGYYSRCKSLPQMLENCEKRLNVWRSFMNLNTNSVPSDVLATKSSLADSLHSMGNLLGSLRNGDGRLPLFVVIDQYEVLPELNVEYGTELQRLINGLIKARDPVVFYKIGARTYDWGRELRIWGAESRIEVQRDYSTINLADVLMRKERSRGWLFPKFALDVGYKRMIAAKYQNAKSDQLQRMLGKWSAEEESWRYFRDKERRFPALLRKVPPQIGRTIRKILPDASPLELRLAAAWVLQQMKRGKSEVEILEQLHLKPWQGKWWRKERVGVALIQVAAMANQKKLYYGWRTVAFLSGANISAFLLICSEIWDMSAKVGIHPLEGPPLPADVQTDGIFVAADKWSSRDRNEHVGGRKRWEVFNRLGTAIHQAFANDLAISNPGHSGFSVREADLWGVGVRNRKAEKVASFLENAVSWAHLEERRHTSKLREGATRRKWYLHPLLSPVFTIPHIRVKEPLYTTVDQVYGWIFRKQTPKFGAIRRARLKRLYQANHYQLKLPLGDVE